MPEIFICPECKKRVNLQRQDYVITNKATARTKSQCIYAHYSCVAPRACTGNPKQAGRVKVRILS